MKDHGVPRRTRGALRYQRRKARKIGVAPEDVEVTSGASGWKPTEPIGEDHVRDLAYGLGGGCLSVVVMLAGIVAIFASGGSGDIMLLWMLVVLVGTVMVHYDRTGRWF